MLHAYDGAILGFLADVNTANGNISVANSNMKIFLIINCVVLAHRHFRRQAFRLQNYIENTKLSR